MKMNAYIALLRAVNVMGNTTLPMAELKSMCESLGFQSVRTYIASGNVIFKSTKTEAQIKALLASALAKHSGRPVAVHIRTAAEMAAVLGANPFPQQRGDRTLAHFIEKSPPADALRAVTNQTCEELALGQREIYVYYANGVGESRLNILAAKEGTARNMNTVAKLAELAAALLPIQAGKQDLKAAPPRRPSSQSSRAAKW
jgi:uncharacterized protein (DUF1697 family)